MSESSSERRFARSQRMTVVTGILCVVLILPSGRV